MNWNTINSIEDIAQIKQRSMEQPCLIFKHSTTCSISLMAKSRLEMAWDFTPETLEAYYLDLKTYRSVSNHIAETFEVHHESPQALLIVNGECIYDCSHLDITVAELHEGLMEGA
jgi:bacillithiol system protein YtxJ